MSDEFVNTRIDTENENLEKFQDDVHTKYEKIQKYDRGKDIIQLKSNFIPIGMISLEKVFDQNDVAKDPKVKLADNDVEDQNIGTEETPRVIKLSKNLPAKEK